MNPLRSRAISLFLIFSLAAPAPAPVFAGGGQESSINENRKPLSAEAIAKISKALYDFAWAGYVSDAYKKAPGADKNLQDAITGWVKDQNKKPETIGRLADLYYVMNAESMMAPWTGKAEAAKEDPQAAPHGQLAGGKYQGWLTSFFDEAETHARAILKAPPKEVTLGNIIKNEERPGVPAGTPSGQEQDKSLNAFDRRGLYERGGAIANVYREGDGAKNEDGVFVAASRTISIKIWTRKNEDGSTVDELGICDLTTPGDLEWRHVPINSAGGTANVKLHGVDFSLTLKPKTGGELGDMSISFNRPKDGNKARQGIDVTLGDLYRARAEQAVNEGVPVNVDGTDYLIIGQGGPMGAHLYFPADVRDRVKSGATEDLRPEGVAFINQRKDNQNQNFNAKPDLGTLNGKPYHLELQPKDSEHPKPWWKAVEGPGDVTPSLPAKPKPTGKGEEGGEESGGGGQPSGGSGGGSKPPPMNDGTLSGKEAEVQRLGTYVKDPGATVGASPKKIRIWRITEKGEESLKNDVAPYAKRFLMVVGGKRDFYVPFYHKKDSAFEARDVRVILGGKFLMTVSDQGVYYFSIDETGEDGSFVRAGIIDGDKKISEVKDKELLAHAMGQAGFDEGQIKAAMDNLDKLKAEKPHIFGGSVETNLVVTSKAHPAGIAFWPKIEHGAADDGTHKGTKAGLAFDVAAGPFQDFQDAMEFQGEKLSLVKKTADAVFYVNDVAEGKGTKEKPRKWYFMFAFNSWDKESNKAEKKRSAINPVFGQGKDSGFHALPTVSYEISGLMDVNTKEELMTTGMKVRMISPGDTTPAKGVWAAFVTGATGDGATSKSANCLGPVIWWGMDKAAALKACQKDSL